jgi:segregation and condensation protein A
MYQIALEKFHGPVAKLLELIEEKQLEVTEVSLAKVTDDFLKYLAALTDAEQTRTVAEGPPTDGFRVGRRPVRVGLREMAEFVAVASRLILIKSKVLLPDFTLTPDEEAEIHELESRLAFYKSWRPAEKCIAAAWKGSAKLYGRPYFLSVAPLRHAQGFQTAFYPSANLTPEALIRAMEGVREGIVSFTRETETLKERIIAIEEKIAEVLARLTEGGRMSFHEAAGAKHVSEVVALFLAVLHLAREGRVHLEQKGNFSDIMVSPPKEANTRK